MDDSSPTAPGADPDPFARGIEPGETRPRVQPNALLFGRYRVLHELGRGGMGVVQLASDEKLGHKVAIKVVQGSVMEDPEAIGRLRKEVLRGMALTHPGIARTNHFEQDENSAAIVMEFVEGRTLAQLMKDQPGGCFDEEQIRPWFEQLAMALDYAHSVARLAHRDLKPSNIMVTDAGWVKVADFGLASALSESHGQISIRADGSGTPQYMSPQQFSGAAGNRLDDVYSFGATIYALLTGKPPFFRGNVATLYGQVVNTVPPAMTTRRTELGVAGKAPISAVWEETIAACLVKDPAKRPQSTGEVMARLRVPFPPPVSFPAARRELPSSRVTDAPTAAARIAPKIASAPPPPPRKRSTVPVATPDASPATLVPVPLPQLSWKPAWLMRAGGVALAIAGLCFVLKAGKHGAPPATPPPGGGKSAAEAAQPGIAEERQARARLDEKLKAGQAALQNGKFAEARKIFQDLLVQDPGNQAVKAGIADTDRQEALAAGAKTATERQLQTKIDDARAALAGGRLADARKKFEAVLEFDATNAAARSGLEGVARAEKIDASTKSGQAALAGGKFADARQYFQSVLGLDATNAAAKAGLENVGTAEKTARAAEEEAKKNAERVGGIAATTREQPWENSLGMRFVPISIGGGPTSEQRVFFSIWSTRVKDFAAYVADGHPNVSQGMYSLEPGSGWKQAGRTWKDPGFAQTPEHPVVGVNWQEARDFCEWLTAHDGKLPAGWHYRLPSDAEWSAAAGNTTYPWGEQWVQPRGSRSKTLGSPPKGTGNFAGRDINLLKPFHKEFFQDYDDGYARTSPVGSFPANRLGLYDMSGNVWQWCEDWYRKDLNSAEVLKKYKTLEDDGGGEKYRVLRGASWDNSDRERLLSAMRLSDVPDYGRANYGFRCVIDPTPHQAQTP